jgi:flavin-dependent dehydrogenase
MTYWDVVVAGAGPAGIAAASVLTSGGSRVLLADRPSTTAHKIGEALPGAGVRILKSLGLPIPRVGKEAYCIRGNLSAWGSGQLRVTDFMLDCDGPGWRLNRMNFEEEMRRFVCEQGAEFRATRIAETTRAGAMWRIRFKDGSSAVSRWLVDATGRNATVARRLSIEREYGPAMVAVYALGVAQTRWGSDRTLVESAPRGWWYAAWLPSGAPIAVFHAQPDCAVRLRKNAQLWHQALRRTRHVGRALSSGAFPGPLLAVDAGESRLRRFSGDGWIACGDAAMAFDPIAAQGLLSALYTGRLAGHAVLAELQSRSGAFHGYSERLEQSWAIYKAAMRRIYHQEDRWRSRPFWAERQTDSFMRLARKQQLVLPNNPIVETDVFRSDVTRLVVSPNHKPPIE